MKKRSTILQIRGDIGRGRYMAGVAGAFVTIIALWSAASWGGWVQPTFLPTPLQVLVQFGHQISNPEFWHHVGISIFRVSMGFLLACAIGVPLGILAGTFHLFDALVLPQSEFVRYMPASAFVPLIMVWAGIGEMAKIWVIFLGCIFQIILMVADNVRSVPNDLLHVSYTLGASRWQAIEQVLLRAVMPDLVNTLRMMIGWAWTYLVVAELVAAGSGLGFAIMKAQRFLNTDLIFVGIITIGLLGLLTDRMFAFAHKRLFPWLEGGR